MASKGAGKQPQGKGKASKRRKSGIGFLGRIKMIGAYISRNLHNGRIQILCGIMLAVFVAVSALAMVSHIVDAGPDQGIVLGRNASIASGEAHNLLGPLGAWWGNLLFNGLFGYGTFALLLFAGRLVLSLIWKRGGGFLYMLKHFVLCSFWAVWIAVVGASLERLFGYEGALLMGGRQGDRLCAYLIGHTGVLGLVLVIIVSLVLALILVWDKFLFAVRDAEVSIPTPELSLPRPRGLWGKVKAFFSRANREEPTEDEEIPQPEPSPEPVSMATSLHTETEEQPKPSPTPTAYPHTTEPAEAVAGLIIERALGDDLVEVERTGEPLPAGMLLAHYRKPDIELLRDYEHGNAVQSHEEIAHNKQRILDTLASFKLQVTPHKATVGPTVTLYEVIPAQGIKISRIKSLEDDLALNLKSEGIRIIAPMPGTGTIGIEVPNSRPHTVSMRSIIASRRYNDLLETMELPVGIGKTITNEPFVFDLTKMPHLLIAGATGQGKSVGLNAMITSLLYSKRPEELKFVMVDPKMLEFSIYEVLEKHFLAMLPDADKAIITDMSRVVPTLNSLCIEMDNRYKLLTRAKVRNIKEYNEHVRSGQLSRIDGFEPLPYIVLIVDEFADLIMTSGREVEQPIARLAQKARAAGIHMVIATQRPSTDVITGLIKANFPARIAFKVFSMIDSRTILDSPGANQLIGRGDMLFYQGKDMIRIQCAFMDTPETEAIVRHIASQESVGHAYVLPEYVPEGDDSGPKSFNPNEKDSLFEEVARMIVTSQVGSTSNIQRKFNLGYNRAGRLMDQLEGAGIVGVQEGSKPREVLVKDITALEHLLEQLR